MSDFFFDPEAVRGLLRFCAEHGKTEYCFVGDHGVYIMAFHPTDSAQNCVVFAKGCDPKVDGDDWYDRKREASQDDFGEDMPVAELAKMVTERATKVRIRMTSKHIVLGVASSPAPKPWQVIAHYPTVPHRRPLWAHPPKDEAMARAWVKWAGDRRKAGKAEFGAVTLIAPDGSEEFIDFRSWAECSVEAPPQFKMQVRPDGSAVLAPC